MFSPEAEHRLQSIMGLQTWNLIRAFDFVESLPETDPDRLAVTGNSGGGTQTILLGAIDPRVKCSFPNGMVSTSMQGGCYCENCNYLRIGTGNVELAALMAPKPQAMTAVNDWTRDMMKDGYPELRWLYAMIGNESDVYCREMLHFPHNFNYVSRATMYQWMNKHMELGLDDPIVEQDYKLLSDEEAAVWNDKDHPAPKNVGPDHEREVCTWLDEQAREKLKFPSDDKAAKKHFVSMIGTGWQILLDPALPAASQIKLERRGKNEFDGINMTVGILNDTARDVKIPIAVFEPILPVGAKRRPGPHVIWTDPAGLKVGLGDDKDPNDQLRELVRSGATVITADWWDKPRMVEEKRHYSAFSWGYNRTVASERVRDLMSTIVWAGENTATDVRVFSTDGSGAWAAAAIAFAPGKTARAVLDTDGFRFESVRSYKEAMFVPGTVKYGDVPALLAGCAPTPIRVFGESDGVPEMAKRLYKINDADAKLEIVDGKIDGDDIEWLTRPID